MPKRLRRDKDSLLPGARARFLVCQPHPPNAPSVNLWKQESKTKRKMAKKKKKTLRLVSLASEHGGGGAADFGVPDRMTRVQTVLLIFAFRKQMSTKKKKKMKRVCCHGGQRRRPHLASSSPPPPFPFQSVNFVHCFLLVLPWERLPRHAEGFPDKLGSPVYS